MTTRFESSGIPEELRAHARWVSWRYVEREGQSKPAKMPIDPKTGRNASSTDPATWATFEAAEDYAVRRGTGIGLVLTADSGLCCIDLDATDDPGVQGVHRVILDDAAAAGAYIEASPSGKGWHIWLRHDESITASRAVPGVECYSADRFMTVTGMRGQGRVIPMPDSLASRLAACFAAPPTPVAVAAVELPPLSDDELLNRCAAHFGFDGRFQALWSGQWQSLHPSQSEADFELGVMLARFTSDADQWLRLFLRSGLAATLNRKKTEKHARQYVRRTYEKARERADDDSYHIAFGRRVFEIFLARWRERKAALVANLLEPFSEFIQKKVSVLKLVRGVLGEGGLSVLYGAPGAGKSFLALDLGLAVATGKQWMGRDVRQGPVIYAVGEGVSGLRLRGQAIAKAKALQTPPIFFLPHSLSTPDEGDTLARLLDVVAGQCGVPPALLIIDTLSRFFGEGDENSAKDMKRFIGAIGDLAAKSPTLHVMVVHHSGKDAERGMRGSSALQGAADTVLHVAKDGDLHRAVVEKQKDGQGNVVLPFALEQVELGDDEDGEPITSCVVVYDQDGRVRPLTGWAATAVQVLRQQKASVIAEGGGGNLATEIPLIAYHNHWYLARPNDKKDTVRKTARRQLEMLREKKALEWSGGESPIRLLPAFDGITIELGEAA